MRSDIYTKIVLSGILILLAVIAIKPLREKLQPKEAPAASAISAQTAGTNPTQSDQADATKRDRDGQEGKSAARSGTLLSSGGSGGTRQSDGQTQVANGRSRQLGEAAYIQQSRDEVTRQVLAEHDAWMARGTAEARQIEEIRLKFQAAIDAGECDRTGKPPCADYQSQLRADALKNKK